MTCRSRGAGQPPGWGRILAMTSTTPLVRRSVSALFAGALLLTACGSSGGSDSSEKDPTTTAAEKATTTTAADEEATTTVATADGPTADELAAIIPTAADFGEGWVIDESEPGPESAVETATAAQCPDAAALLAPAEDDEVTTAYTGPMQESARITLASGVDPLDPADVQAVVDSVNGCDAVTAEEDGVTYTVTFDASANDQYGDGGVQIAAAASITDGTTTYEVTKYRVIYTVGSVGLTITGGDGLAEDGTVTPIDEAGLDAIATEMAKRAETL